MHDEYGDREAISAAATDPVHSEIDTTILNGVLCHLPLFLSEKSVFVTMTEEAGHILFLSTKYHAKASGHFILNILSKTSISV